MSMTEDDRVIEKGFPAPPSVSVFTSYAEAVGIASAREKAGEPCYPAEVWPEGEIGPRVKRAMQATKALDSSGLERAVKATMNTYKVARVKVVWANAS